MEKKIWSESCVSTSDFQKSFAFKSFERESLREWMQRKPKCGELRLWFATKVWSNHNAPKNNEQYGGKILQWIQNNSLDSDQKAFWKYFSNITKHI